MKFACLIFFTAFAVAVDTIDVGVKSIEESMNSQLHQDPRMRNKRSLGVNEELKREVEIKKKDGSSIKISKSITYNDGGALTLLPAVMDSATNNRIRLLNQIQNGHGRPELANSMINGASSGADSTDFSADGKDFNANIESRQASASANGDATRHIDLGNIFNHPTTTTSASISVEGGSSVESGVAGGSHVGGGSTYVSVSGSGPVVVGSPVIVNTGSTGACCGSAPVVAGPIVSTPVVVNPVISKPTVVNPIITDGVCCGQSKPVPTVPVSVVAVNTGHSHGHGLLKKHLEKSVEYHRRKQAFKQYLLDKLAAKHQQTSVVTLVPVHHIHTPDCGHLNPVIGHHSRYQGLKELITYKREMKAQRHRNKIAAIHAKLAQHTHHARKCPSCCCN